MDEPPVAPEDLTLAREAAARARERIRAQRASFRPAPRILQRAIYATSAAAALSTIGLLVLRGCGAALWAIAPLALATIAGVVGATTQPAPVFDKRVPREPEAAPVGVDPALGHALLVGPLLAEDAILSHDAREIAEARAAERIGAPWFGFSAGCWLAATIVVALAALAAPCSGA